MSDDRLRDAAQRCEDYAGLAVRKRQTECALDWLQAAALLRAVADKVESGYIDTDLDAAAVALADSILGDTE